MACTTTDGTGEHATLLNPHTVVRATLRSCVATGYFTCALLLFLDAFPGQGRPLTLYRFTESARFDRNPVGPIDYHHLYSVGIENHPRSKNTVPSVTRNENQHVVCNTVIV